MLDQSESGEFVVDRFGRLLLIVWSLFLSAGFALAVSLDPDPRGFGTHQSLGLPPCSFRTMFHLPCPSCGMTTSFSNFVRGRIFEAMAANWAGVVLAVVCAVQIPWCWVSLVRGRLWKVSQPDIATAWLLGILCTASLLQWVVRLIWP